MSFSNELFEQMPAVGILRGYDEDTVLHITEQYYQAGFRTLEITMNTPNALDIIAAVTATYGDRMNIGAGTVLHTREVAELCEIGASFVVSPITDVELIRYAVGRGLSVFPGAYSPTEIYQAWTAGAHMVKVFPARDLGPDYIADVLAPLDDIALLPTGGVTTDNIDQYWAAGARGFGFGGFLFPDDLIQQKDWAGLGSHLAKAYQIIHTATAKS